MDSVKVLWCVPTLFGCFLGSHPYMHLFSFENVFALALDILFVCLFVCFKGEQRRKRGERMAVCMVVYMVLFDVVL